MGEPIPTPRELEALKVLWKLGHATVRDVYCHLKPQGSDLAYTSILSLMQTMEKKGLVSRTGGGQGRTHQYVANVRADHTLRRVARTFLDTVFDGALAQYVVRALEARKPKLEELDEIEEMIAKARQRATEQGKQGGRQ
jgi:predicted transcriptional regulator